MNDFTKDELILIHDGLSCAVVSSLENCELLAAMLIPITFKIQSMIENYSEEEGGGYMSYRGIGEAINALFISLIVVSSIGVIAMVYIIGHFFGFWA